MFGDNLIQNWATKTVAAISSGDVEKFGMTKEACDRLDGGSQRRSPTNRVLDRDMDGLQRKCKAAYHLTVLSDSCPADTHTHTTDAWPT